MITTLVTTDHEDRIVPPPAPGLRGPNAVARVGTPVTRRRRMRITAAGIVLAGALAALGGVLAGNADFSERYVTEQLSRQRISFKPVAALTPEERKSQCVVENAGKALTTGKQAECYANEFIGTHVRTIGKGKTYAELGDIQTALRGRIAEAQANGDPALTGLQKEMTDLNTQRETVFKAETLRGILLTSFGFSELGAKGAQAATAAFVLAGLVALASMVGMVHTVVNYRR